MNAYITVVLRYPMDQSGHEAQGLRIIDSNTKNKCVLHSSNNVVLYPREQAIVLWT